MAPNLQILDEIFQLTMAASSNCTTTCGVSARCRKNRERACKPKERTWCTNETHIQWVRIELAQDNTSPKVQAKTLYSTPTKGSISQLQWIKARSRSPLRGIYSLVSSESGWLVRIRGHLYRTSHRKRKWTSLNRILSKILLPCSVLWLKTLLKRSSNLMSD